MDNHQKERITTLRKNGCTYSKISDETGISINTIDRFTAEKEKRQYRDRELRIFIKALKSQPAAMTEWSDRPWVTLLDHVKVCADGTMIFVFKDGTEIMV